jgi:hypothetical protein
LPLYFLGLLLSYLSWGWNYGADGGGNATQAMVSHQLCLACYWDYLSLALPNGFGLCEVILYWMESLASCVIWACVTRMEVYSQSQKFIPI